MADLVTKIDPDELVLTEKLVYINRVSKVMKGGKRLSFSAFMVTGDGNGHVGIGQGKAKEVPVAISKAGACARKSLIRVPLKGTTIPHEIRVKFGAAEVLLKPAAPGTGIIAGSSIRMVMEAAGIKDVLTKSLGSSNRVNMAKTAMRALERLRDPEEVLAKRKGVSKVEEAPSSG